MNCPNCGKKVDQNSTRCSFCGIALNNNNNNNNQKIKSIIGIDINDLNKDDINMQPYVSQPQKLKKENTLDLKLIINIFLIIIVIILSLFLIFKKNQKCPISPACPVCENKTCVNANEKNYYIITENYEVFLPNNWQYQKKENLLNIYQDNLKIIILGTNNGIINKYGNIETKLKTQYETLAINDIKTSNRILNNHNFIAVDYQKDNLYYRDFYYQINSNSFIYGQINSSNEDKILNNSDIDEIIQSIKNINDSNIEINDIDYEEILKAFK